jgi:hypothetical protein
MKPEEKKREKRRGRGKGMEGDKRWATRRG